MRCSRFCCKGSNMTVEQRRGKNFKKSTLRSILVATIMGCSLASFYVQRYVTEVLTMEMGKKSNILTVILSESQTVLPASSKSTLVQFLPSESQSTETGNSSSVPSLPETPSISLGLPEDFPSWMTRYFNWHAKRRKALNETNWESEKYLILRCTREDKKCGGLADRLKPLPYFLLVAAQHKRLFLIRWTKPTKLEEFLSPNKMDWTVPDWMEKRFENGEITANVFKNTAQKLSKFRPRERKARVVEGKIQDILGGAEFYEKTVTDRNETYEKVFHNVFKALFKPSPPIEEMLRAKMTADHLTPGEYSVAHYRAFYGIEDSKQQRKEHDLRRLAINAANCASAFRPGGPVYFASDSKVAVEAVRKYAAKENRSISVLEGDEALHIDKYGPHNQRPASDFYSVFVDLLLMANGKCLSYGRGGFGRFALLLSQDATCSGRHFYKLKPQKCRWMDASQSS